MERKRITGLILCGALAAGLLYTAPAGWPVRAAEAEDVLPPSLQRLMEAEGFVGVSPDQTDSLKNVIFNKADGSKALYMYDRPVKYQDETGEIRFKSETAAPTDKVNADGRTQYAYENPDNDIKAYMPRRVADGLLMEKDGYQLEIFPEVDRNSRVRLTEEKERTAAVYAEALEENTDLSLGYTLDGIRMEIGIEEYTGQNEYTFTVDPHGLVPQQDESHVMVFQDPETGEAVCTLQPAELCSAVYEQTGSYTDISFENRYRLQPAADGKYTLTMTLDEAFLSDPAAALPLRATANIEWQEDTKDTTVFQGDSGNYHTAANDYVGYYQAGRNKMRAMKLAQMDAGTLKYINPDNITSAKYYSRVTGAAASWDLIVALPTFVWDPTTVQYDDISTRWGSIHTVRLTNTAEMSLYVPITQAVVSWLKVELAESTALDSRQGIILMPGSNCPETSYRIFRAAESAQMDRPAFVVEFTEDESLDDGLYFIRNGGCERYLDVVDNGTTAGTGTCIYNFHGRNNQLWYVNNDGYGRYTLRPYHASGKYLAAEDEYASPLALSNTACYWRLVKNGDNNYRIVVDGSERQAAESAAGSIENENPVKTWGYGGAPNQKWVFEKATQIGGAGAYRQVNTSEVNCFSYAMGWDRWISPGSAKKENRDGDYLLDRHYEYLEGLITANGMQCRRLSSKSSYVRPNEYKIVVRSGDHDVSLPKDSHFMVQINTGAWAEKMGELPSENLGFISPETYSWNYILPDPVTGEPVNYFTGFYDSPLMYIAVWK